MQGIARLFASQKAWVVGLAVAGIVLLGALGKLPMDKATDQIKWMVLALLGAQGVEDAAGKFGTAAK